MLKKLLVIIVITFPLFNACTEQQKEIKSEVTVNKLEGEYLGQTLPGDEPELFAPGFINRGLYTRDVAMTPEGDELYFTVFFGNFTYSAIMCTKRVNGVWGEPEIAPFVDLNYFQNDPFISHDGKKLFFHTNRPVEGREGDEENSNLWVVDKTENGWSDPYSLGAPVNTEDEEFFPSLTNDGTLYFSRSIKGERPTFLFRSRFIDGKYQEPEKLPEIIQAGRTRFNSFVASDESYIIYCIYKHEKTLGSTDYYISFRSEEDEWTEPLNLGKRINTSDGTEYSPFVSPDGKVFFFMSSRVNDNNFVSEEKVALKDIQRMINRPGNGNACIYWIGTGFIEQLRAEAYK